MAQSSLSVTILSCAVFLSSCSLIELRKDIFMETPIWEDSHLLSLVDSIAKKKDVPPAAVKKVDQAQSTLRKHPSKVGLESLVNQVLPEREKDKAFFTEQNFLTQEADTILAPEDMPLPPDIAKNNVTKAMVLTILKECENILRTKKNRKKVGEDVQTTDTLPRMTLSDDDFSELGKSLAKKFWTPAHIKLAMDKKATGGGQGFLVSTLESGLTWTDIFTMYLMEYYHGNYVDRYGVSYDKPKLDFRITNDAIVALANIFQESLWDYSFAGLVKDMRDPMVYKEGEGNSDTFLNGTGKVPTFAKILRAKQHNNPYVEGLVEVERGSGNSGLDKRDVCVIHYFSGLSGDQSEAVTAAIVRTIGGSNLGFVLAYGKFSIGDNETLTKLIDATVKIFSKRTADLLFSTILYEQIESKVAWEGSPNTRDGWEWIEKHIKIADFLNCFKKEGSATKMNQDRLS